jgi:hypothetical protein
MTTRCRFCLTTDHTTERCAWAKNLQVLHEHGVIDPATAEEVNDVLALRMIGYRTYAGQLERLLREAGHAIPAEVSDLNPDLFYA